MNTGIELEYKNKIIAVVSALIPEAKIYLFGSRARESYRQGSDIDLALDAGQKIEPHWRSGEVRDALRELFIPYRIDVLDIYRVDEKMRQHILENKIIWKE